MQKDKSRTGRDPLMMTECLISPLLGMTGKDIGRIRRDSPEKNLAAAHYGGPLRFPAFEIEGVGNYPCAGLEHTEQLREELPVDLGEQIEGNHGRPAQVGV